MKKTLVFLIILCVASISTGGYLYIKNTNLSGSAMKELATAKEALAVAQSALDAAQSKNSENKSKIAEASANAKFLTLALCPALESSNKEALCMSDSTEWFSQTMIAGTMISDPTTKSKMDTLLVSLGAKIKPTTKQLYEKLKPIEVDSLKALSENLK